MTTIRAAAIQVRSENGELHRNLANAEAYVADAAAQGAQLVICPEFLATGYIYEESIWSAGERRDGPTEQWLRRLARAHGVHIGAGYLEAEGDEFYNTYTLVRPDGDVAGRVRKGSLPACEGWFFRPDHGAKVIETALGRIGVGICNDNQTCWFRAAMEVESPDLIVMPHSAPTAQLPVVGGWFGRTFEQVLRDTPVNFARALGVPVIFANKVLTRSATSLPILPRMRVTWEFSGHSALCAAGGSVVARASRRQMALVSDLPLTRLPAEAPGRSHFYWSFAPPVAADPLGRLLLWLEKRGQAAYDASTRRREAARRLTVDT